MRGILRSVAMAFACFSAIPMPHIAWERANMRYMMAAFPLVGVVVGGCVGAWAWLCAQLGAGPVLKGAGIALIPIALSGGIHMDGLADVVDALSSHASPERKREILKDPHAGAFASIGIGCYLVAAVGLASEVDVWSLPLVCCVPVLSRCLSGLATVTLRAAKRDGMYASEQASSDARVVRCVLLAEFALVGVGMLLWGRVLGALTVLVGVAVLAYVRRLAKREFGGMSGDLAGFFLQMAELAMLACIVLGGKVV